MNRILLSALLFTATLGALAQAHPGTQPRQNAGRTSLSDSAFEEKLVQLALAGPQYDATTHQVRIAQYKVKSSQLSWFNLLTLSLNYNDLEFTKQPAAVAGQTAYVFPKYYFGLVIPIGTIVSKGTEVKAAKEDVKIVQDNQLVVARQIRADVLTKYAQYRNARELALIESQIVDDLSANFSQVEKKFQTGSLTIEAYNTAAHGYNEENAKKLSIQLQEEIIKLDLERLIGVRLETVAH
jgi:outer membrane protein TolC